MKILVAGAVFLLFAGLSAQNFAGEYLGQLNGDQLYLSLQQSGGRLTGQLKDSGQTYAVDAQAGGNSLQGTATESSMGLLVSLDGTLEGDVLDMTLSLNLFGMNENSTVRFVRQRPSAGGGHVPPKGVDAPKADGKSRDPNLAGAWLHEEMYNSGYGGSFMGANTRSIMVFFPDGGLGDGGSSVGMSGGNYYGQSSGNGQGRLPNVVWYTEGGHIFLETTENGQSQIADLGRYYIENGRLLITGNNGQKLLLTQQ